MYQFTDRIPRDPPQLPAKQRSSESIKYNGVWLEDVIPEFRVLNVEGRELMKRDVTSQSVGDTTGEYFKSAKYPTRTITVKYQIIAASNTAFRAAFESLNLYLSPTEAELIFADDSTKYFIATKASNDSVDPGSNSVTGEISFLCLDPRKYSTTKKTYKRSDDGAISPVKTWSKTVTNAGNVPVSIDYVINIAEDTESTPQDEGHETGMIGIISANGAIQLGNAKEKDSAAVQKNAALLKPANLFNSSRYDASTPVPASLQTTLGRTISITGGSMDDQEPISSNRWLYLTGAASTSGQWNGAARTYGLRAAGSQSDTNSRNFYCYTRHWFQYSNVNQVGMQYVAFLNSAANPDVIAGIVLRKGDDTSKTGTVYFIVRNKIVKTHKVTLDSSHTPYPGVDGHESVEVDNGEVTFYFNGKYETFKIKNYDSTSSAWDCHKVQIFLGCWENDFSLNKHMRRNYVDNISFKNLTKNVVDMENRFQPGDTIKINGTKATVKTNGMRRVGDEAVGSEFFKANPGNTDIEFTTSRWANNPFADIEISFREAWL